MDSSKDVIKYFTTIAILTTACSIGVKTFVKRDGLFKVVILAFAISLELVVNYFQGMCFNVEFWIYSASLFVAMIGLVTALMQLSFFHHYSHSFFSKWIGSNHFLDQLVSQQKSDLPQKKNIFIYLSIIAVSLIFFFASLLIFMLLTNIHHFMTQPHLFLCLFLTIGSLLTVYLVDWLFADILREQTIKRKLFHIGPLFIVPAIHKLNPEILVTLLSAGFYLLLVLQIIRYSIKQIKSIEENHLKDYEGTRTVALWHRVQLIFTWMGNFNTRQKQFWFTHLFLILSLLISYDVKLIFNTSFDVSQHIVLCMIAADGMAAIIGKKYGKIKINGHKSLQGCMAFAITFLMIESLLQQQHSFTFKLTAAMCCSIAELYSGDADNIVTILVYYLLTLLFND